MTQKTQVVTYMRVTNQKQVREDYSLEQQQKILRDYANKNNLKIEHAYYVNNNKGMDSFIDMYLMSQCKYAIIANSTFSYWGAINGCSKSVVIYPSRWKIKATGNMPNIFKLSWTAL